MTELSRQHSQMKKNPPQSVRSGEWVYCKHPSSTTTKGKKYKVRNYFYWLNKYGSGKDSFYFYDEFITIKNYNNYTVKMNLLKFEKCPSPDTKKKDIANTIKKLLDDGKIQIITNDGEIINELDKLHYL